VTGPGWPAPSGVGQSVGGSLVIGDVVMVSGVGGAVTITTKRPRYRVEPFDAATPLSVRQAREQPSRLLLARHEVVGFTGREVQLADLAGWLGESGGLAVRLVHAAGGQGKTRLARRVAASCQLAGWEVWRVLHTPTETAHSQVKLPTGDGVVAVVDYADRWPVSDLLALLTDLRTLQLHTSTTVRVLMVARSAGFWWDTLRSRAEGDLGADAAAQPLPPLAARPDRDELFRTARRCFADAMQVTGTDDLPVPPALSIDDAFAHILTVHMAALVAVDAHRHGDKAPTQPHALSAYLLRRERAHWHTLHARTEDRQQTSPATMGRAVYVATLTGAMRRDEAHHVLHRVQLTEPGIDTILDDHRFCYPPQDSRTVLESLHPDRLGEDMLALTTPGHEHTGDNGWQPDDWATNTAHTLLSVAEPDPPAWAPGAVTVLIETARRWQHVAVDVLYPMLRQRPDLAIAAGGAALTRLADLPTADIEVLEAIEARLPDDRHVDLDLAAAAITTTLTRHRLAATTDPADRARLHATHAWRLANAGHHQQALAPSQDAAELYRQLAQANPAAYLPDLATSLNNLGAMLSELGRREEALAPSQDAVAIRRQLAQANPAAYLPNLAGSLNNLGIRLSELGRREEALAPSQDAAELYRQLAQANPAAYLPNLAGSLNNLGIRLSELGRREEALAPSQEAVAIRRQLAQANPAAYLPDLATSLWGYAWVCVNIARDLSGALAAVQEAISLYTRLTERFPAVFAGHLVVAYRTLVDVLDGLGHTDEATQLRRQLDELEEGEDDGRNGEPS
jgi:tetratricopeptide (TPR) repeat protein